MAAKTYNASAPECPHCGHEQGHDGGFFYDESMTEFQCERCDRVFAMSIYTSTLWTCTAKEPT